MPDIQFHVQMLTTQERLSALMEAGIGLAFIPSTARNSRGNIHYLQVEDYELVRKIALIWHKSRYISRAAMEFREVVEEHFGTNSE